MKRALAVAAHPDDIEFLMMGTLLRLRAVGYEIHYLNLANGCCGTAEQDKPTITRVRRAEAMTAAQKAGAIFHEPLVDDLEIFYDRPTLRHLAAVMREVAPHIVLTHAPVDYMEDHQNACRLAVTAAFARGMVNFPVAPPTQAVQQSVTIYHAQPYGNRTPLGDLVHPTHFVDTTDLIENKVSLLSEHKSQKDWLDRSQGLDSYLETLRDLDRQVGRMSNRFEFAEGWRKRLHLGFCDERDDPLAAKLGAVCRVEV